MRYSSAVLLCSCLIVLAGTAYQYGYEQGQATVTERQIGKPLIKPDVNVEQPEEDDEEVSATSVDPEIYVTGVETKNNDFFPSNHAVDDESDCPSTGYDDLVGIEGGSMRPAFWHGNHVMLEDLDIGEEIQPGSIVSTDEDVLHAVEAVYEDGEELRLKGYDNSERDDIVSRAEVESVAVGVCWT